MLAPLLLLVAQTSDIQTFDVGGIKREAVVVRPKGDAKAPLVFVYHGHGGNMRQARRSFEIERRWPEAVVIYPQGLPTKGRTDPEGKKNGWQQNRGDEGDRDLAFFDAMLKWVKPSIDPKRVYVTGHSNGGRMTYLLWAERGDTFAAVAPSASPGIGLIRRVSKIPAFIIAGEKDEIVPFAGQKLSIDGVRRVLGTDRSKAKVEGFLTIEPGPGSLELASYVFPGGHTFAQEAVEPMVAFFKRHRK